MTTFRHIATRSLLAILVSGACATAGTDGRATVRVTTVSADGKYAPRHVLAVWVTDADGGFVKTLAVRARKHRKSLRAWSDATADREDALTDAVTGATLKRHETRYVSWDCRDTQGNVVPDGVYRIFVEFSEKGRGPVTDPNTIVFTKGPDAFRGDAPDTRHFRDVALIYRPAKPDDSDDGERR